MGLAHTYRAHEQQSSFDRGVVVNQTRRETVSKILRLMFRVIIVERALTEARRNARRVQRSRAAVRSAAVADHGPLSGFQSSARAEANRTDAVARFFITLRPRGLTILGNTHHVCILLIGCHEEVYFEAGWQSSAIFGTTIDHLRRRIIASR